MINSPDYIREITPFIDKPLVKILSGVRRCGKSTIFEILHDELIRDGVPADSIITMRYTEMDIPEDLSAKQMYDELIAAMGLSAPLSAASVLLNSDRGGYLIFWHAFLEVIHSPSCSSREYKTQL